MVVPMMMFLFFCVWPRFEDRLTLYHGYPAGESWRLVHMQRNPKFRQNIDILFCGSSVAAASHNEEMIRDSLGRNARTLSHGNLSPWGVEKIFKRYKRDIGPIKVMVLEIEPRYFDKKGFDYGGKDGRAYFALRDWYDITWPDGTRRLTWEETLLPKKTSLSQLYQSACATTNYDVWPVNERAGYWRKRPIKKIVPYKNTLKQVPFEISPKMRKHFFDFIAYCRSENIFLVVNLIPFNPENDPRGRRSQFTPTRSMLSPDWMRFIADVEKEEGVAVIGNYHFESLFGPPENSRQNRKRERYGKSVSWGVSPDNFYGDFCHMTKYGAAVYTNYVISEIKKNADICERLGIPCEPDYQPNWTETFTKYVQPPLNALPTPKGVEITWDKFWQDDVNYQLVRTVGDQKTVVGEVRGDRILDTAPPSRGRVVYSIVASNQTEKNLFETSVTVKLTKPAKPQPALVAQPAGTAPLH